MTIDAFVANMEAQAPVKFRRTLKALGLGEGLAIRIMIEDAPRPDRRHHEQEDPQEGAGRLGVVPR